MAVTDPAPQNVSSLKEILTIFYRYKLNFFCITKSEDSKKDYCTKKGLNDRVTVAEWICTAVMIVSGEQV